MSRSAKKLDAPPADSEGGVGITLLAVNLATDAMRMIGMAPLPELPRITETQRIAAIEVYLENLYQLMGHTGIPRFERPDTGEANE